ncbi:transposase [Chryseobacterium sp.]|uniref:transposase n=1 Tax=Chryseobacterium sp. TaxID=1871047 RepID=UPI002FC878C1
MNFKNIHIGSLIKSEVVKNEIEYSRISICFSKSVVEIEEMFNQEHLSTELLLKWSKLLEYDFFRLYSQHLILFSPQRNLGGDVKKINLPVFRKNIYTKEMILFILERIDNGKMSKLEVINTYKIPKTTLYKWISKYSNLDS